MPVAARPGPPLFLLFPTNRRVNLAQLLDRA
jgi:hypothetical protein